MAAGRAKASRLVGRYQLVFELGQSYLGAFWAVCTDGEGPGSLATLRLVSLARLDADTRVRLLEAAWQAMEVANPHVCPVTDVVASDGELGVVCEYIEGLPLRALQGLASVRRKPVTVPIALRIIDDMIQGVSALHEASKDLGEEAVPLFGGLSPDSVLVAADGRSLLLDTAVACAAATIETIGGNPERVAYAAPEQLAGPPRSDARTDVFAIGIVAWELLSNRRLFIGSDKAVAQKVLAGKIPRLDEVKRRGDPDIPPLVLAAVMKALERDPAARFQTVAEFGEALRAAGVAPESAEGVATYVQDVGDGALARLREALKDESTGARTLAATVGKPRAQMRSTTSEEKSPRHTTPASGVSATKPALPKAEEGLRAAAGAPVAKAGGLSLPRAAGIVRPEVKSAPGIVPGATAKDAKPLPFEAKGAPAASAPAGKAPAPSPAKPEPASAEPPSAPEVARPAGAGDATPKPADTGAKPLVKPIEVKRPVQLGDGGQKPVANQGAAVTRPGVRPRQPTMIGIPAPSPSVQNPPRDQLKSAPVVVSTHATSVETPAAPAAASSPDAIPTERPFASDARANVEPAKDVPDDATTTAPYGANAAPPSSAEFLDDLAESIPPTTAPARRASAPSIDEEEPTQQVNAQDLLQQVKEELLNEEARAGTRKETPPAGREPDFPEGPTVPRGKVPMAETPPPSSAMDWLDEPEPSKPPEQRQESESQKPLPGPAPLPRINPEKPAAAAAQRGATGASPRPADRPSPAKGAPLVSAPPPAYYPSQIPPPLLHDPRANRFPTAAPKETDAKPSRERAGRGGLVVGILASIGLVIVSAAIAVFALRSREEQAPPDSASRASKVLAAPAAEPAAAPAPAATASAAEAPAAPSAAPAGSAAPAAEAAPAKTAPVAAAPAKQTTAKAKATAPAKRAPAKKKKSRYVPDDI